MFAEIQEIECATSSVLAEPFAGQEEVLEAQQCVESEYERSVNSVREKFGLATNSFNSAEPEPQVESLTNLFDEGALEIKLESDMTEDFDVHDALSDQESIITESSEEDEENESDIEQLSDSQLRKHEESLFQDDSSDSGKEERKKRRKKYKKSDEEKLFE